MTTQEPHDIDEIRKLVEQINHAWVNGHPEELASFFHEDITMVHPDFVNRTNGREACIAGYLDFCTQANITEFKLGEPGIDVLVTPPLRLIHMKSAMRWAANYSPIPAATCLCSFARAIDGKQCGGR